MQPHKSRSWLNTPEEDPKVFARQVEAVCDTYREAPAWEKSQGTHTVCMDEMTGLQALERNAAAKPMSEGKPERIQAEYTRHGTIGLIGNFEVTTGELIAPTLGATRTEDDFAGHIERTVATDAEGPWVFVVDNRNIHCSESLVSLVAQACEITTGLGKRGVSGVQKSLASGRASLSERGHRIRFVYLPKRVQSRQCQRFCGISGLFSARTPLSSILKGCCSVNLYDGAAAPSHAAAPRAVPDPSPSHTAPGLSERLRRERIRATHRRIRGTEEEESGRSRRPPTSVLLRRHAPSPWPWRRPFLRGGGSVRQRPTAEKDASCSKFPALG